MAKKKQEEVVDTILVDKKAAIGDMMAALNKKVGRSVVQFGLPDIEYISTGIDYLDQLMGGGLMAGRITTMMGAETSGKTSLTATMVAAAQRKDPNAVWLWLDFENSLYNNSTSETDGQSKRSWLNTLGVDTDRLVFIHSLETMEEYCNFCLTTLRNPATIINGIVIDSIGAMIPQGAIYKKQGAHLKEKGMEADTIGLLARSLGKFLSMVKGLLSKHKCPMIAITHIYADIQNGGYSVPKGGNAFRHFADLRLNLTKGPRVNWPFNEKENDKPIFLGFEQVVTLDKTKNSSSKKPGTQINLPFIYGKGIDEVRFLANRAILDGFVNQAGAYFYWDDNLSIETAYKDRKNKVQGTKNFWNLIDSDQTLRNSLLAKYKGADLFSQNFETLKITNETEDVDIEEVTEEDK